MKAKLIIVMMLVFSAYFVSAQGIQVEPNTCINVESETTLNISGGGNLVLESDDTGDASLIDIGSVTYTGGGEAKVQRYLTQGKWHLISAPVSNALAGMFPDDYLQYHAETTNDYHDVSSITYQLNIMQGYSLWSVEAGSTTEVFSGTTNTGNQNKSFTQNGDGWNLMGNPYPSVLDWDAVTIPAELNGAIWLFDPTYGTNGDYRYYIKDAGKANTTTQYIPSGQGFFVRATGGNGILQLENSDRVHGVQAFYKDIKSNEMLVLKATGNNITTQTAIRFIADATPQADRLYDIVKIISGSPDVPVVYSKCENQNMAINTLPSVAGHETVPVYFEAGMDGIYVFNATEMESLGSEIPVYLEDVGLNYIQDLRSNPEYSFDYTAGAVKDFKVHFKDVTGIEQPENFNVLCYLANNVLHVNFPDNESLNISNGAIIAVYNTAGQQLLIRHTTQPDNEISFRGSQSVYLVCITTDDDIFTTKVFNK